MEWKKQIPKDVLSVILGFFALGGIFALIMVAMSIVVGIVGWLSVGVVSLFI